MVFAYVFVKGQTIYHSVYWFFNGSSGGLVLPPYYAKVVYSCGLTCDAAVVM